MVVFIVTEHAQYDYDGGQEYQSVYGVYSDRSAAFVAATECEGQAGGHYYASIEEHEVQ